MAMEAAGPVPGTNEVVMQPLVDGAPFGSPVTGGPTMSWTLDTTLLTDGTHAVGARAVSCSTAGLATPNIGHVPLILIVQNSGTKMGAQTIPVVPWTSEGQDVAEKFFPPLPDFVTFPGVGSLPTHNTAYPYPAPLIAGSTDPKYRDVGNFYVESTQ